MSDYVSKIITAQARIVSLLEADSFFTDADPKKSVAVIKRDKGNIASTVLEKLQKVGIGVVVMLPIVTSEAPESTRLMLGLKFALVVTENPIINRGANGTQKEAEAVAERVLAVLHGKANGVSLGAHAKSSLFQADVNAIRIMEPTPGSEMLLNYTVAINTTIAL